MIYNKWKNPADRIIKFLYKKDSEDFIYYEEISSILTYKEQLSFNKWVNDLEKKDYIETNSRPSDIPIPDDPEWKPGARIIQPGREYYKDQSTKNIQRVIGIITLLVTLLTFWFLYLKPNYFEGKITIPTFKFKIVNNSLDTLSINPVNEFTIWFPIGKSEHVTNTTGLYEIQNYIEPENIYPGQTKIYDCKIQNENRYVEKFKNGDCDFAVSLGNSINYMSNHLYFSNEVLRNNLFELIIKK